MLPDYLKEAECAQKSETKSHETVRKDLPTYSADDVSKHSDELDSFLATRLNFY